MPELGGNAYDLQPIKKQAEKFTLDIKQFAKLIAKLMVSSMKTVIVDDKEFVVSEKQIVGEKQVVIDKNIKVLNSALEKLVGNKSTYTNKKSLEEDCAYICHYLSSSDNLKDEKIQIANKLNEGITQCSPGFHTRVNIILMGLNRPVNFGDFLQIHRQSIVSFIAKHMGNEVHFNNTVSKQANELGYGTQIINPKDVYLGSLSDQQVIFLSDTFGQRYTPLNMLGELRVNIESELRNYYGYDGYLENGYDSKDLNSIKNFLEPLFNESWSYDTLFQVDEDYKTFDINWRMIQDCIWQRMRDAQYIKFSEDEQTLFRALYSTEDNALENLFKKRKYVTLMHEMDLPKHLEVLRNISDKNREAVIKKCLPPADPRRDNLTLNQVEADYLIVKNLCAGNTSFIDQYAHQLLSDWISIDENKKQFLGAPKKKQTMKNRMLLLMDMSEERIQAIFFEQSTQVFARFLLSAVYYDMQVAGSLIKLLANESITVKEGVFLNFSHNKQTLFMLAIRLKSKTIPLLLEEIMKLPSATQVDIFSRANVYGFTALRMAQKYYPELLTSLLDAIKKLPLLAQLQISQTIPYDISSKSLREFKENFIINKVMQLDQNDPIENVIRSLLLNMSVNAMEKQAAIIDAYDSLKSEYAAQSDNSLYNLLEEALSNNQSALYKALNQKRYGFFLGFNQEADSLKILKKSLVNYKQHSQEYGTYVPPSCA